MCYFLKVIIEILTVEIFSFIIEDYGKMWILIKRRLKLKNFCHHLPVFSCLETWESFLASFVLIICN